MGMRRYHGLVNRKRILKTLEDKANLTGFDWIRPKTIPKGFVARHNAKGEFIDFTRSLPITIQDVDGREKHTAQTSFLKDSGR